MKMRAMTMALSELQTMDGTKKDVLYEMGLISEATGNVEKAGEHYKEIYQVDIGYKDIRDRVEKAYGEES